ncbi:MAG: hypothetical protein N3D10_00160 [Candidatus Micrarchaeota archaeon]|nr:hypothetical protein [Candidatus Micrarchaeota archaeon]
MKKKKAGPKTKNKSKSKTKEKKGLKQKKKAKAKIVEIKKIKIKKDEKKQVVKRKKITEPLNKYWKEVIFKDPEMRKWAVRQIGEHVIEVINKMDYELSDEEIAKRAELKPSDVRVVLNRLHAHGLAYYTRKRDKKSGWYNYIWSLLPQEAKEFYEGFKKIKQEVKQQTQQQQELYYSIVNGEKKIYTFEEAFNNNFICPISGKPLKYLEKKEVEQNTEQKAQEEEKEKPKKN